MNPEYQSQTSMESTFQRAKKLSVAIPIYNEVEVLPELLSRLNAVLDQIPGGGHEIVFADDGSSDGSREFLSQVAASNDRVVVIELSRNFGHQAAITAALDHVTGDIVAVMDGDLQDPPEMLPEMLARYAEGYEVVYAKRINRKENLLLRFAYKVGYRFVAAFSEIPIPLDAGDFALLDRRVVDHLRSFREQKRYLRGLRAWIGYRQTGIEVERDARLAGASKYSTGKLVGLTLDGLFSFSVIPLRLAAMVGSGAMAISSLYALYAIGVRFLGAGGPPGFTALIVALVFLSGVQLFFLGVLGEYVGRIYQEIKRRPIYLVSRIHRNEEVEPVERSPSGR